MGISFNLSERKAFALAAAGIGAIVLFGVLPSMSVGGLMLVGGLIAYKLEDQKEKKLALVAKK